MYVPTQCSNQMLTGSSGILGIAKNGGKWKGGKVCPYHLEFKELWIIDYFSKKEFVTK